MNFIQKALLKKFLKSEKGVESISVELKKQLADSGLNEEMASKFVEGVKKNPELFFKMAEAVESAQKEGRNPEEAVKALALEHQEDFKQIFN